MSADASTRSDAKFEAERLRAGGKAAGLMRLLEAGVEVPPFVAIAAAHLEAWAHEAGIGSAKDDAAARQLLERTPPPATLVAALEDASRTLGGGPFAVRSSALDEDSMARSHAGQLESVLFVGDPSGGASEAHAVEPLLAACARCLASSRSAHAVTYRRLRGGEEDAAPMVSLGVVVQRMIEGEVSGVAFTADPASGALDVVTIAAAYGLCEGVVQGSAGSDTFTIDKASRAITRDVVEKPEQIVRAATGAGTRAVAVEEARRGAATLDDESVQALVSELLRLEAAFGFPLDVEWTRAAGRFVFLQVRPITTGAQPRAAGVLGSKELVWDNANIVESYSGPTTALTFSYIRFAYAIAYQQSCELGGVPREEIRSNQRTFHTMLGFHEGRVYYNLHSWYRLLSLFPGFEKNKEHMERMMGVRESARLLAAAPSRTGLQRLRMALAWVQNLRRLDRLVRDFEERLASTLAEWPPQRFASMSLTELADAFHALVWRLLWHWQAPLVTDFAAMMSFGVLSDLTKKWGVDQSGALANDLLGGEGDVASLEPTRSLLRLADQARQREGLRSLLEATEDDRCLEALRGAPEHAPFLAALEEHLQRWGDRCIGELKLEEPSLAEEPRFLFAMLKNYLRREATSADALARGERERRIAAEARARQALGAPWKRAIYFWFLRAARKHMKSRESMRFGRTRTFGLLRRLALRAGELFVAAGKLETKEDVFHLTLDELLGAIEGTGVSTDLGALAAVRKAEHARHVRAPDPPDRFTTRGAAALAAREARIEAPEGALKGTPCSPGRVRGRVRVIHDPHGDLRLDGEILVAARTDPGWVPLFPSASGLLVERGSPLSHSAIVARELGLPTIVNVPGLLLRLKDGMMIEMDGAAGTIAVIEA
jgi:rifampicin phosphotransferase